MSAVNIAAASSEMARTGCCIDLQLLSTIDRKRRNKLDKSGDTIAHLTVTNRLTATAVHAHALKVARLFSLIGDGAGQEGEQR